MPVSKKTRRRKPTYIISNGTKALRLRCGDCFFFEPLSWDSDGAPILGECRFNAPLADPGDDMNALFPTVHPEADWCGSFRQKHRWCTERMHCDYGRDRRHCISCKWGDPKLKKEQK